MGEFRGHALPGVIFLLVSVWWFIGELRRKRRGDHFQRRSGLRSSSLRVWYSCEDVSCCPKIPVEPLVKIFFAVIGIIAELVINPSLQLINEDGNFYSEHLNNYSHSVMYGFFGLSGAVDLLMWYRVFPFPPRFDFLMFSIALWIEGLLFFTHLHGRSDLDVRLHSLLYVVIFVTAAAFLLQALSAKPVPLFPFCSGYLLSLQGTWFLQVGYVLYGPNPWESSVSNIEFTTIAFAFHVLTLLVIHLIGVTVGFHLYVKRYQHNNRIPEGNLNEETNSMMLEELPEE